MITGERRSASVATTGATTGATTAARTSWARATSPAMVAPPRLYAYTSMAIHTAYSLSVNSAYPPSTRSSARLPASERKACRRRAPESLPTSSSPGSRWRPTTGRHAPCGGSPI
jgi:hypothetical protein